MEEYKKITELKKRITETKQEVLLIGILILAVLPFLILNYFNQPTSEDFFYGEETARIGFIDSYRVLFKYWGGRYFEYILMMINPLYFKSIAGYKALTFLLMILYFYILYLFVSEFTKRSLSFRDKIIISLSIFFLYLYSMPSVSQGFYWYFSAIFYHVGLSLILLFSIFYNRQFEETRNSLCITLRNYYSCYCRYRRYFNKKYVFLNKVDTLNKQ